MTQLAPGQRGERRDALVDPQPRGVGVLDDGGGRLFGLLGRLAVGPLAVGRLACVGVGRRHSLLAPEHAARVNRGGSWNNDNPSNLRAANRNNNAPANRNNNVGFRCARPAVPVRRRVTALRPALRRAPARGRGALGDELAMANGSAPRASPDHAAARGAMPARSLVGHPSNHRLLAPQTTNARPYEG